MAKGQTAEDDRNVEALHSHLAHAGRIPPWEVEEELSLLCNEIKMKVSAVIVIDEKNMAM